MFQTSEAQDPDLKKELEAWALAAHAAGKKSIVPWRAILLQGNTSGWMSQESRNRIIHSFLPGFSCPDPSEAEARAKATLGKIQANTPATAPKQSGDFRKFLQFFACCARTFSGEEAKKERQACDSESCRKINVFSEKPGAGRDSDREIAGAVLLSDSDIAGDITRHSSPNSELGIEGLAKYRPYHRHLNKDWGVFFDAEAILNSILALREQGLDGRIARGAVLHMLYYHEILHAKVEAAASWLEVVTRKEVYVPFFDGESGQGKSRRDIEEAVATWVGFEKGAEKVQGESLKKKVRDFFGESVAGLSGYGKWKEGNQKCEELATMITGDKGAKYHENIHRFLAALGENKLTNEGLGDEDVYHMTFDEDDVPLYVVGDEEFVKVLFPQGIS